MPSKGEAVAKKIALAFTALAFAAACPSEGSASETITYTYDAQGRVVAVTRSGTANSGVQTTYTYDHADNRVNVTTVGAPAGEPGGGASTTTYRRRYVFNGHFFVSFLRN